MERLNIFFTRVGGKGRIRKEITYIIEHNIGPDTVYIEPFVGGGSIFLYLNDPNIKHYIINDKDKSIFYLWDGLKNCDLKKIKDKDFTLDYDKFEKFKNIYIDNKMPKSCSERFYIIIYLIFNSFIGNKTTPMTPRVAKYKINRFSKGKKRIERGYYKEKMDMTTVLNQDYKTIINKYKNFKNVFFYLDPPFTMAEKRKHYDQLSYLDPEELFDLLSKIKGRFLLSYDNAPEIKKLVKKYNFKSKLIEIQYTIMGHGRFLTVKELLIANFDFNIPSKAAIEKYFK